MRWLLCLLVIMLVIFESQGQGKLSAQQYYEKGEVALRDKSYRTALAHFNECLRLAPYFYEAYYSRGLVRDGLGDKQGALTDFSIYLDSKPDDKEALFTRATIRYDFGQWAVAKEDFLTLLKLPEGGETNTVYFQSDQSGEITKALTAHRHLRSTIYNYLGLIDTKLLSYSTSIPHYDSAIRLEPTNADYLVNRGLTYFLVQDTIRAKSDFEKALRLNPENSLARHNLALLLHNNTQLTETLLTEAIESNPNLPYSYAERGMVRSKSGNLKGALEDYNQAIRLNATDPDYWLNRGIVKEHLKDIDGALSDYAQVITLKPDYEKGWLNHGNALVKQKRFTEAIEDYTTAIVYYPDYALAFYNRSIAYHRLNKMDVACNDLERAEQLGLRIEKKIKSQICKAK